MSTGLIHDPTDLLNTRFAILAATATAILTTVALALGLVAVPVSGANCPQDCIAYPYLDTVDRFPRDYLWMYAAIAMVVAYLLFIVSLRVVTAVRHGVLSQIAVTLAVAATVVLTATYYTQVSVVPVSLAAGETQGITMITMYNPHGLFIALEEVGYLLMSLSFLFAALMVTGPSRMLRAVRLVFAAGFILPVLALAFYSFAYGLDRMDRFEVAVIAVDWLVLIVNGILVAITLRNRLRTSTRSL